MILTLLRSFLVAVLILLCAGIAILLVAHEGRVAIRAAMVIAEVLPGSGFHPLERISDPPIVQELEYPYTGGMAPATLYRPAGPGTHGAVVLYLGINPDFDNASLRQFSQAVARQGAVVLLAHGVALDKGKLSLEEVDALVGAVRFLKGLPYVNEKRIGLAGFCLGGSLSMLAAGDPRIAGDVRFVNTFGGYYSAESLMRAMTTQTVIVDSKAVDEWQPNDTAYQWFLQALFNALPDAKEREDMRRYASGGFSLSPQERAGLPPRERALYNVLANHDPTVFGELYEELPADIRSELARFAVRNAFPWIQAKVLIMADHNDTYVPYTESKDLNVAMQNYSRRAFTEFDFFDHMTPGKPVSGLAGLREVAKLWYHLYLVMLEMA